MHGVVSSGMGRPAMGSVNISSQGEYNSLKGWLIGK